MSFCEIKTPPEFSSEIEKWDRDTLADGEKMGNVIEKLLNNTVYNNVGISRMNNEIELTLPASGWSASAPYTQTVDVPGLKETDKVLMMSAIKTDTAAATADIWDKMGALVKAGKALDGQAVFYCPKKKPTSDFNIKLVGVSANE